MTFEQILPDLKKGKKAIRTGWEGTELYIVLVSGAQFENSPVTPYFLIKTSDESFSAWSPTSCDVLADDWQWVE